MQSSLRKFLPENSRQYRDATSQRITWGHWFVLFNIVLSLVISARYGFNADWPNTLFGKIYFFISLFGHFSFVVFAIYLLLLFPLSFLIKNDQAFRGISVTIATVGLTMLMVDTEVFKQFYLHLSPLVWDLLVNPDEQELSRHWQLLFVPMPLILLVEMLYSRWCWQKIRSFNRQKWGKWVALGFLSCFTATHLLYAFADMTLYRPITAQKANYPLSYPMTARSFLENRGLIDHYEFEQTIRENGRLDTFYLNYPRSALYYQKTQNSPNLFIVNISGLTNHDISEQNTPTLAQISQHSRRFLHHYSGGSSPSAGVISLFYGLSGKYEDAILNEKVSSPLIKILKDYHYQFGLFSHHHFEMPIYRQALFADFKLPKSTNNLEAINHWKHWIAERSPQQPFFSYLELVMPKANDLQASQKLLDWQITEIWTQLNAQQLLDNTLVLLTADIGRENTEHHANDFDRSRIQVPLFLYWQGQGANYQMLSSHLDIMPTLLSLFGLTTPVADYSQGVNLTQNTERKWLLASNRQWDIAIMPDGEQYHIDKKGNFEHFDANGEQQKSSRPPLALFLQLLQTSNRFMEK